MFALCPNKGTFYVDVYRCSEHTEPSKFITRSRATDLSTAIRNIVVSLVPYRVWLRRMAISDEAKGEKKIDRVFR